MHYYIKEMPKAATGIFYANFIIAEMCDFDHSTYLRCGGVGQL